MANGRPLKICILLHWPSVSRWIWRIILLKCLSLVLLQSWDDSWWAKAPVTRVQDCSACVRGFEIGLNGTSPNLSRDLVCVPYLSYRYTAILQLIESCERHIFGDDPSDWNGTFDALSLSRQKSRTRISVICSDHFSDTTEFSAMIISAHAPTSVSLGYSIPVSNGEEEDDFLL